MKKIMFDDRYGLTQAVLEDRKTMTRRIVSDCVLRMAEMEVRTLGGNLADRIIDHSFYCYQEEVAVAQKYLDLRNCDAFYEALDKADSSFPLECIKDERGCYNKMFVKAEWMPHHIRIIDIKVERLQNISEEDCLREGIFDTMMDRIYHYRFPNSPRNYFNQREAFAALIDKVSGKGTWESNPWVFAYTFELID